MFCRFCGTTLPDDSIFCESCGKSLATQPSATATNRPEPIPPAFIPKPEGENAGKKVVATLLIVLFSLMLLGENAQASKIPKNADSAYLLGQLFGIVFVIVGFILSVKWQIKLSGYRKTSGRQAVAIFLIVFCCWGLLLVVMLSLAEIGNSPTRTLLIPIVMGLAYVAGLYRCVRWRKKLRLSERVAHDTTDTALSKGTTS
jgi:zinc-ribbon domain